MFVPARFAIVLAVPALCAGTAFADAGTGPPPAPAAVAAQAAGVSVPVAPVPGAPAASPSVPIPPPAPPAPPAPGLTGPAPAVDVPPAGIVRAGTAEEGCFADKEEYLDAWHATGVAPDPCFVPPTRGGNH